MKWGVVGSHASDGFVFVKFVLVPFLDWHCTDRVGGYLGVANVCYVGHYVKLRVKEGSFSMWLAQTNWEGSHRVQLNTAVYTCIYKWTLRFHGSIPATLDQVANSDCDAFTRFALLKYEFVRVCNGTYKICTLQYAAQTLRAHTNRIYIAVS